MRNSWIASYPRAIAVSVVFVLLAGISASADGRPHYLKTMLKMYPDLQNSLAENKCMACHPAKNKKLRNNYGEALGKALSDKNVKILKQLTDAFKKIEPQPSAIEGKTFGDWIRMGKLPASTE